MNKFCLYFVLISISIITQMPVGVLAADIEAGRVASTQCAMCHGADGRGNGVPGSSIAGMDVKEFKKHLMEFKSGARRNYMMEMFVNRLSAQDFDDLAAYFATQ